MAADSQNYPARLGVDYPAKLDRFTTFVRILWIIPIFIVLSVLSGGGGESSWGPSTKHLSVGGGSIMSGLAVATGLMIVFRQRYPRWWFNFALELSRFSARVGAYAFLLTDQYPSTVEKQAVKLDVDYPDVEQDLNRWLPLVKWFLAIPHYIVLMFLLIGVVFATIFAWFAILFTGRYPQGLFDYAVGVGRWALRVNAYAFLLVTDEYPPFSLAA